MVLNPCEAATIGAPEKYARKTAVFKMNGNYSIRSSDTYGNIFMQCYPQKVTDSSSTFLHFYTDGTADLDVTNMPTIANLTNTIKTGPVTLTSYYQYVRLVAFELTMTYVGAVQTGSGELSIGFDNFENGVIGYNVKNNIQDSNFHAHGRAEDTFRCIWIPQDDSDFDFRAVGSTQPDKANIWGSITAAGTGFPVTTECYDLQWTAIIEGMTLPLVSDFIPKTISPPIDLTQALLKLKNLILSKPSLVAARKLGSGYNGLGQGPVPVQSESNPQPSPMAVDVTNRY